MNTGQTFLTIGAFILLSTLLVNFYRLLLGGGETIDKSQAAITQISLATSIQQTAQALAFDERSIDSVITTANIGSLTAPASLDPDNPPPAGEPTENSVRSFDDFDDFNNFDFTDSVSAPTVGKFRVHCNVYYVSKTNIDSISTTRTFVKRMDIKIWRSMPPLTDTLKSSFALGYFHFD